MSSPRAGLATAKRVWNKANEHQLSLVAAGVAFYAMLAVFPAIVAIVTIYAMVADPMSVRDQLEPLTSALPQDAANLLVNQLTQASKSSDGNLTIGLIVSLLFMLWSVSGGVEALITGLNVAYGVREGRGFLRLRGLALVLTFGAIVAVIIALGLIAGFPIIVDFLGFEANIFINVVRWAFLVVFIAVSITVLYRWGPDRAVRWEWFNWGSAFAVLGWIVGSAGFAIYVGNFSSYNETYGALAAVIVLMLWLFLSSYVVLLGAEINADRERRARSVGVK